MTRVLVIAEHDGRSLHVNTAKCVTCARAIGAAGIDIGVLAADTRIAAEARSLAGVDSVLSVVDPRNASQLSAVIAPQAADLIARGYTHALAPSSSFGKDLMPRVAALLGVGQISDIMAVDGPYRFRRPIYAGNAIVTIDAAPGRCVVATVRTASFPAAGAQDPAPVETQQLQAAIPSHTRFVELRSNEAGHLDLQTSARVVSGGRGLGSAEQFALVYRLADALGAAVGASRAAVDSGYVANDLQVGQTGKIVAPQLYVALGISGAIQHLTGIKDARTIVAINKDPTAPIFEVADIGLVADLFQAVPELIEALRGSAELR